MDPKVTPVQIDDKTLTSVEYIEAPQREAYAAALTLHKDKTRADGYKQQEISRLFAEASAESARRADAFIGGEDSTISENEIATLMPLAVDAAEASAYLATKSIIESAVSAMDKSEFVAFWQSRLALSKIEPREKLTLRILLDHHMRLVGREEQGKRAKLAENFEVKELVETTRAVFLTDSQRAAAIKLEQAKVNKAALSAAKLRASQKLRDGWAITTEGEILSNGRADTRQMIRG